MGTWVSWRQGEGLSGTGHKAGGPHYVARFAGETLPAAEDQDGPAADPAAVQATLDAAPTDRLTPLETTLMPGPTGESNRLALFARGTVLCLGPGLKEAEAQAQAARAQGCAAVIVAPGAPAPGVDGRLEPGAAMALQGLAGTAPPGPCGARSPPAPVL